MSTVISIIKILMAYLFQTGAVKNFILNLTSAFMLMVSGSSRNLRYFTAFVYFSIITVYSVFMLFDYLIYALSLSFLLSITLNFIVGSLEYYCLFYLKDILTNLLNKIGESPSKFFKFIRYYLFLYIEFLMFLRSIFKEYHGAANHICLALYSCLLLCGLCNPLNVIVFGYVQGVNFISLDVSAQLFSGYLLSNPRASFTILYNSFIAKQTMSRFYPVRFVGARAAASIFFGSSGLTPTGKSAVLIAAAGGIAVMYNGYKDRQQRDQHLGLQLEEAERQRAFKQQHLQQKNAAGAAKFSSKAAEADRQRTHEREKWTHEDNMKKSSSW
jgi:hypothetical protein